MLVLSKVAAETVLIREEEHRIAACTGDQHIEITPIGRESQLNLTTSRIEQETISRNGT